MRLWGRLLRAGVRGLDTLLRRVYGIREFSREEWNLFRLAVRRSLKDCILSDGVTIHRGDPIGELHFWNEHIPSIPAQGPDLGWALAVQRQLVRSLRALADHVESTPDLQAIQALGGEIAYETH